LLDLAAILSGREVELAMEEAEVKRHTDRLSLPVLLARYPRRHGGPKLREILARNRLGTTLTGSELEERFLRFIADHGLPTPEMNAPIAVRSRFVEVDGVWRREGLIVELDGRAFHGTTAAFERDRSRDRALMAAGWRVVRITWRQLDDDPDGLANDIQILLGSRCL
jgi:hypothetical protein